MYFWRWSYILLMNVPYLKGFLRKLDESQIKISGDIEKNIIKAHQVPIEVVLDNVRHPDELFRVETQESRRKHDECYRLPEFSLNFTH